MNDDNDIRDQLASIERHLNQIKWLLGGLFVIILLGLPGMVARAIKSLFEMGFGLVYAVPFLVGCYLLYVGIDFFFLRPARDERERLMEEKLQQELTTFTRSGER